MNKQQPLKSVDFRGCLVRVTRLERAIYASQMRRSTNSAIPGYSVLSYYTTLQAIINIFPVCGQSCDQSRFLARFVPRRNLDKARVTRLFGLQLFLPWMVPGPLPNQARYLLCYTWYLDYLYGARLSK